ncbi:MAG: hypothetical protein E7488_00400 [Ruminococcaceae bacterium]|nr:hypothetical protein [Oscillospiraceae bacterium]
MKFDFTKIIEYISHKGKSNLFVVIGIAGIMLIFISDLDFAGNDDKKYSDERSLYQYKSEMEKEITSLLEEIEGVGEAKVMITLESGEENIYVQQQKTANDTRKQQNDNNSQEDIKTTFENEIVIVEESGNNSALIEKTIQPVVQGVAVVCSGADDIKVVSAVTNSVSVVLNVPTNRICVTKMR